MTEAFVQSGSARLWTATQGSGIPLLRCNGGPGCCDYLAPVAAMLDDLAQVTRFEARGCGRSDPAPAYDMEGAVKDLEAVREHYGFEHWVVGGHSWGPDLALAYALKHPQQVLGLIGIAGGRVVNDRSWHEAYVYGRDHIGEAFPDMVYPFNDEVNRQLNASWRAYTRTPSLLRRLAELKVPALFVYGSRDIRPSWPTEQLAELLPQGHFVRIEGAAHLVWATHADALRGHLQAFVRELAAGGS